VRTVRTTCPAGTPRSPPSVLLSFSVSRLPFPFYAITGIPRGYSQRVSAITIPRERGFRRHGAGFHKNASRPIRCDVAEFNVPRGLPSRNPMGRSVSFTEKRFASSFSEMTARRNVRTGITAENRRIVPCSSSEKFRCANNIQ